MADLYLDLDGLVRTRNDIERLEPLLRDPVGVMTERADAATEIDALRSRLRDFGDAWDYGIGRISKYTDGVAEALTTIRTTFLELDDELASTFEQEG